MGLFEKASRQKLRFDTVKGSLTTEDLWDLPLTSQRGASLDGIAMGLNRELKDTTQESFVLPATTTNTLAQLKLDVVKHVIAVRQAENTAELVKREAAAKKQRILGIIDKKQNEKLEGASLEELEAELAAL